MTTRRTTVAMLVTDANEGSGFTRRDSTLQSPVLHPAVENLVQALKNSADIDFQIVYGRANPDPGEARSDGNLTYVPVPYRRLPLPGMAGTFLGRAFAIWRRLRELKPDLVHAQGSEKECGLVAALSRPPSVLTLHGILQEIAKRIRAPRFSYFGLASMLERFAVARVSMVHCISSHTKAIVGTSAKQTTIIPNAVDDCYFGVVRHPSDHPEVVCIADITEWKGPLTLVEAGDALHAEFPGTRIHFFGACNESYFYGREFLDSIQSRPWCVFHGTQPRKILSAALSRATCAVLPSKAENFGLALAEAMAAGVPCIGSNTGGIPDIITHRVTGLLFETGNPAALSEQLLELHRHPGQADAMAAAGKEHASKNFNAVAVAEAHERMYGELLA